jgi:protein-S-isoprenylcysteine O-methyltransferase Ste14
MSGPIILSLAVVIYAAVHSLLASLEAKEWARRNLGPTADHWYRLAYNAFAAISGLPILALLYILPDESIYQVPSPWILLTAAGQLIGILIIIIGIWQTDLWHFVGIRQIVTGETSDTQPLVITGLYRWMRHPLYTGGLLLIWLVPTMTVNLLTIFIWLTIYLIVGARLEERRLIDEFGDDYREYQKRVPMLLPRILRKP